MENNIKNKIEERKRRKINVNITLDEDLIKALRQYKERHMITQLSPMINEMLWEFIKKDTLLNR